MIAHFAAFTWVPGTSAEDVSGLESALRTMAGGLPFLLSYECGENLRLRPSDADFGVLAMVRSADDLERYLGSDAHAEVQQQWLSRMTARRVAVQLAVPDAADR